MYIGFVWGFAPPYTPRNSFNLKEKLQTSDKDRGAESNVALEDLFCGLLTSSFAPSKQLLKFMMKYKNAVIMSKTLILYRYGKQDKDTGTERKKNPTSVTELLFRSQLTFERPC